MHSNSTMQLKWLIWTHPVQWASVNVYIYIYFRLDIPDDRVTSSSWFPETTNYVQGYYNTKAEWMDMCESSMWLGCCDGPKFVWIHKWFIIFTEFIHCYNARRVLRCAVNSRWSGNKSVIMIIYSNYRKKAKKIDTRFLFEIEFSKCQNRKIIAWSD